MPIDREDRKLLHQFRDEVCLKYPADEQALQELDWFSLSLGFFLARNVDLEKAHDLSVEARYTYCYWEKN